MYGFHAPVLEMLPNGILFYSTSYFIFLSLSKIDIKQVTVLLMENMVAEWGKIFDKFEKKERRKKKPDYTHAPPLGGGAPPV